MILKVRLMGACAVCGILLGIPLAEAGCNLPNNGGQATVSITAPTKDTKLAMEGTEENLKKTDGSELTAFTASPSGGTDDNLCWTFNGFVFSQNATTGVSVAVNTPAAWPDDNSFWGPKPINLKYKGGIEGAAGDCSDDVTVKIYFDPEVEIEGDNGDEPAWFKYWKGEGCAVPELVDFDLVEEFSGGLTPPDAVGKYIAGVAQMTMPGEDPEDFNCFPSVDKLELKRTVFSRSLSSDQTGTLFTWSGNPCRVVAGVVQHELRHRELYWELFTQVQEDYDAWWSGLNALQQFGYGTSVGRGLLNTKQRELWQALDNDLDFVGNDDDLHPNDMQHTYKDHEILAQQAMTGLNRDRTKDWSKLGEQWSAYE